MSSRQLQSKGESDGLSLPAATRKGRGKKSSNQLDMEQQQDQLQQSATVQTSSLQNQPLRPTFTQLTAGESATPATGPADRLSSTPPQDPRLRLLPPVNTVSPARAGTPQVFFNNNTQDSVHTCLKCLVLYLQKTDTPPAVVKHRNITRMCTPLETSTLVMSPRPGSGATVDYSTNSNPDQPAYAPLSSLTTEQRLILNTHNYLLPVGSGRRIYDIPAFQHQPFMLGNGHTAYQIQLRNLKPILETNTYLPHGQGFRSISCHA